MSPNENSDYLPRRKQYDNLLDTVYAEIQSAKKEDKARPVTAAARNASVFEGMEFLRRKPTESAAAVTSRSKSANDIKIGETTHRKTKESSSSSVVVQVPRRARLGRQQRQMSSASSSSDTESKSSGGKSSSAFAAALVDDILRASIDESRFAASATMHNRLFRTSSDSSLSLEELVPVCDAADPALVPGRGLSRCLEQLVLSAMSNAVKDLKID